MTKKYATLYLVASTAYSKLLKPMSNTPLLLCFAPIKLTQKKLRIRHGLARRYNFMAHFKVRHYASKTIDLAYRGQYSMLVVELFIAVLSIAFVVAGYMKNQQFLIFIFVFPAFFSILAALVTIGFMVLERFGKIKDD